jgi:hypothetical protein
MRLNEKQRKVLDKRFKPIFEKICAPIAGEESQEHQFRTLKTLRITLDSISTQREPNASKMLFLMERGVWYDCLEIVSQILQNPDSQLIELKLPTHSDREYDPARKFVDEYEPIEEVTAQDLAAYIAQNLISRIKEFVSDDVAISIDNLVKDRTFVRRDLALDERKIEDLSDRNFYELMREVFAITVVSDVIHITDRPSEAEKFRVISSQNVQDLIREQRVDFNYVSNLYEQDAAKLKLIASKDVREFMRQCAISKPFSDNISILEYVTNIYDEVPNGSDKLKTICSENVRAFIKDNRRGLFEALSLYDSAPDDLRFFSSEEMRGFKRKSRVNLDYLKKTNPEKLKSVSGEHVLFFLQQGVEYEEVEGIYDEGSEKFENIFSANMRDFARLIEDDIYDLFYSLSDLYDSDPVKFRVITGENTVAVLKKSQLRGATFSLDRVLKNYKELLEEPSIITPANRIEIFLDEILSPIRKFIISDQDDDEEYDVNIGDSRAMTALILAKRYEPPTSLEEIRLREWELLEMVQDVRKFLNSQTPEKGYQVSRDGGAQLQDLAVFNNLTDMQPATDWGINRYAVSGHAKLDIGKRIEAMKHFKIEEIVIAQSTSRDKGKLDAINLMKPYFIDKHKLKTYAQASELYDADLIKFNKLFSSSIVTLITRDKCHLQDVLTYSSHKLELVSRSSNLIIRGETTFDQIIELYGAAEEPSEKFSAIFGDQSTWPEIIANESGSCAKICNFSLNKIAAIGTKENLDLVSSRIVPSISKLYELYGEDEVSAEFKEIFNPFLYPLMKEKILTLNEVINYRDISGAAFAELSTLSPISAIKTKDSFASFLNLNSSCRSLVERKIFSFEEVNNYPKLNTTGFEEYFQFLPWQDAKEEGEIKKIHADCIGFCAAREDISEDEWHYSEADTNSSEDESVEEEDWVVPGSSPSGSEVETLSLRIDPQLPS